MEAQLCRFAHRANEQQDAQNIHRVHAVTEETDGRAGHAGCGLQDFRDRSRLEYQIGAEYAEHKAKVTDAVDYKRFDRSGIGRRFFEPEPNQQIAREAHALPAKEHLDEVVGGYQHQHRKGEQAKISEETRLIRVFLHIAPAVEVDERRYAGDHDQHHRCQRVDAQCPIEGQRS